jgi:hypothetical protein
LQVVSNNSIVKIPKWQDVHIKSWLKQSLLL